MWVTVQLIDRSLLNGFSEGPMATQISQEFPKKIPWKTIIRFSTSGGQFP
jgi:hypothetical protein